MSIARGSLIATMLAAAAAAAVGCGGSGGSTDAGMGPPVGGQGITVGNILFRSNHNGTANPAVDTVAAGEPVEWTWVSTGSVSHSVRSTGSPSFTSSAIMSGSGTTYSFTFVAPGAYQFDCAVHGAAMTGRVVVQ